MPHTHWDREWYLPFQRFRLKLVELGDRVLDMLEKDERFVFTLDGQLATADDYIEVRPEGEERIRRLAQAGRLALGPWQTLMDEFLVSGETIVRDLELGLRRAEALGGSMLIGYLPDMFGHVAQMPQILRGAGIDHAVVWRGVPAAITKHAFVWESPDGSSVLAEYLPLGYGNAAYLLDVPGRVPAKVADLAESMRPFFDRDEPILAMYGTDHTEPLPELIEVVEEANRAEGEYRLELATLSAYLEASDGAEQRWSGELRSGARANLLMGVVSARIDLKAAAARAERVLERYAEPLCAIHTTEWPERLLELGWRRMIENSAHDSICGCSVDEVSAQVLVRYAEAEQIGRGLAERTVARLAATVPGGAVVIVNPSPAPAADVVELDLVVPEDWAEVALELADGQRTATQEIARTAAHLQTLELPAAEVPELLRRRLHGRELFGRIWNGFRLERGGERPRLTLELDSVPDPVWLDVAELRNDIEVAAAADPGTTWEVVIWTRPRRRVLAAVRAPPLGWTSARPVPGAASDNLSQAFQGGAAPVQVEGAALDNGFVRVEVAGDGTLRLGGREGVGRLVDGGDAGDSYNYGPPEHDRLVSEPDGVWVDMRAEGPLLGELAVLRTYRWPVGLTNDASGPSDGLVATDVEMHVQLRAGEPFVRIRVAFENRSRDHRLRFHIPLPRAAASSFAEGQFGVIERGLTPEGGHGELPLPTFPAHSFVDAGGIAVLLEHVLEYELVRDGHELALTLLRSTGLISRNVHPARDEPAGPEIAIPDAQRLGPCEVSFALFPHGGDWRQADVLTAAERYRLLFLTAAGTSESGALGRQAGLAVEGATMTALRRRRDWLELRLVRLDPEGGTAVVSGGFTEARAADLLGGPGVRLQLEAGRLELELPAWKIQTIQLR